MRLFVKAMLVSALLMTVSLQAVNQEAQVDILMSKSVRALKENRNSDALASMEQLMSIEASLSKPLPEGFEYLYIETLDKTGNSAKALERANKYVDKYGTKSKNYGKVIEIIGRLEEYVDKKAKEAKQVHIEGCINLADEYCKVSLKEKMATKEGQHSLSVKYYDSSRNLVKRFMSNKCEDLTPMRAGPSPFNPIICD